MTSLQHAKWLASGLHWRLARPLVALRDRLRHYGYTVYDVGDPRHLDAEPPEDHTPYSETGWPILTPYGWVTAIDVMPPPDSGLPSLAELGEQLHTDRQAGLPALEWLKYMNWQPGDGACWHDSWQPHYRRRASTDKGHLHLSARSDRINSAAGDTYDPVARLRDPNEEDHMGQQMLVRFGDAEDPDQIWLCDGIHRRPVPAATLDAVGNYQTHQAGLLGQLGNGGAVFQSDGDPDVWGIDVRTAVRVDVAELTQEQLETAFERTVRKVLGEADGATPSDAEQATAPRRKRSQ